MMTLERLQALHDVWAEGAKWRARAACAAAMRRGEISTGDFFPARGDTRAVERAIAVCASCPVCVECLEFALSHHEVCGVWGATTGRERRNLKHERNRSTG